MIDWLADELPTWGDLVGRLCVIVDGDNGVGKSDYIAPKISTVLGGKVVSVDNYLLRNRAPYLNQIKYDDLRSDVLAAKPVVVEGLCVVKVMSRIGVPFDYHIFVKRMNFGGWENGGWLDRGAKKPSSPTTRDLVAYYKECRPFEKCNRLLEVNPLDFL